MLYPLPLFKASSNIPLESYIPALFNQKIRPGAKLVVDLDR